MYITRKPCVTWPMQTSYLIKLDRFSPLGRSH